MSLLAGVLRDDGVDVAGIPQWEPADLFEAARLHGVAALVADRLSRLPNVPPALLEPLLEESRRQDIAEIVREAELRTVLAALDRAGIAPLLMKGAHLAYSCYARPGLRPRFDTDLLIGDADRLAVDRILRELNYELARQTSGSLVMYQRTYLRRRNGALAHALDVHWRVANMQRFANVLTYQDASRRAERLPALAPQARGLSATDALLVACVHRVVHHPDDDYLIWLYDIHLIASRLTAEQWNDFLSLALAAEVLTLCAVCLERASDMLGTVVPVEIRHAAGRAASRERPTRRYLNGRPRPVATLLDDLRALPSWGERGRLIREHLFPPPHYMRETFAPRSRAPLSVLYARRVFRGARKWFARP